MIDSLRRKHAHRLIIVVAKKFSCSACEESQRRRLRPVAARVLHELGTCFQVDQFEWKDPVLNLHVLGNIMVDAGSRAASVTIHRVMDAEHGLGAESLANPEPIQKELFEIKDFDVVWLPRAHVLTLILVNRLGRQECMGKPLIQSNSQQFVLLEELLTMSRFKKSLMNALQLTMRYIETENFLSGSCCLERHRPTRQLAKILIWLSAVSKWWTKLRNSVSVWRKSRRKRTSRRNCHFEHVTKRFIKPDLGHIGQQVNGAGIGDMANTRAQE